MAYGFNDDKSKVEVITDYPSIIYSGNNNFTLSSGVFEETLTKTRKDGFFFVFFDELPQGETGWVRVYLDDSGHQIASVPLNAYTTTVMGYVPIKKGHKLCFYFFSGSGTATVNAVISDVG